MIGRPRLGYLGTLYPRVTVTLESELEQAERILTERLRSCAKARARVQVLWLRRHNLRRGL